jgi:hypothetical protein
MLWSRKYCFQTFCHFDMLVVKSTAFRHLSDIFQAFCHAKVINTAKNTAERHHPIRNWKCTAKCTALSMLYCWKIAAYCPYFQNILSRNLGKVRALHWGKDRGNPGNEANWRKSGKTLEAYWKGVKISFRAKFKMYCWVYCSQHAVLPKNGCVLPILPRCTSENFGKSEISDNLK